MHEIESQLKRWEAAGLLDAETAARIRNHELAHAESTRSAGAAGATGESATARANTQSAMAWQGVTALILGAILLACGVVLFVSAHWNEMGRGARFALVLAMVSVFHVAGGLVRDKYYGLGTALHAVGTISTGAAIALTGQIFNINEHWPAAVLMWALAALAGWALLRRPGATDIGAATGTGVDALGVRIPRRGPHRRHCVRWALAVRVVDTLPHVFCWFAAQGCAGHLVCGFGGGVDHGRDFYDRDPGTSWGPDQAFLPFGLRVWAWIAIAAVPLAVAAFHGHKGLIPIGDGDCVHSLPCPGAIT